MTFGRLAGNGFASEVSDGMSWRAAGSRNDEETKSAVTKAGCLISAAAATSRYRLFVPGGFAAVPSSVHRERIRFFPVVNTHSISCVHGRRRSVY